MNQWISEPRNDVEMFINEFMECSAITEDEQEVIRSLFRAGYCYYFAHLLENAFNRGTVVWAAPFGHICWQDVDGKVYDIEGEYDGEAYYMIPEKFMEDKYPGIMLDFKHLPNLSYGANVQTLISIMKDFCKEQNIWYDTNVERLLGVKYIDREDLAKYWDTKSICIELGDGSDALAQENGYTLDQCLKMTDAKFFLDE